MTRIAIEPPLAYSAANALKRANDQLDGIRFSLSGQWSRLDANWEGYDKYAVTSWVNGALNELLQLSDNACNLGVKLEAITRRFEEADESVVFDLKKMSWGSLVTMTKGPSTKPDEPNNNGSTYISGYPSIPSAKGKALPLPPGLYPHVRESFLDPSDYILTADELRAWVREAATYHDVPPELLALILQQENNPDAPGWRRFLQRFERLIGTMATIANETPLVGNLVPDGIGDNATGIGNIKRSTIEGTDDSEGAANYSEGAANYIERVYNRPILPDEVKDTALPFLHRDQRIGGVDMQSDLYYVSAHLRQLLDRIAGNGKPYKGPLTRELIEKVATAYNGSGQKAEKYGRDAVQLLEKAAKGEKQLVFL